MRSGPDRDPQDDGTDDTRWQGTLAIARTRLQTRNRFLVGIERDGATSRCEPISSDETWRSAEKGGSTEQHQQTARREAGRRLTRAADERRVCHPPMHPNV